MKTPKPDYRTIDRRIARALRMILEAQPAYATAINVYVSSVERAAERLATKPRKKK